jgi:hypothetical protein
MVRKAPGEMIGRRFTRLTVVAPAPSSGTKRRWQCSCECGGQTTAYQWSLLAGRSRSCGCLKAEELNRRQGHEVHGMHSTPEYRVWADLKSRCFNPKHQEYPKYGGAGITMCDEWKESFSAFYRDMGSRPSASHVLRRYDERQPFCAANCRWIRTLTRSVREADRSTNSLSILEPEEW